ncbi:MAG TPA: hypothetical protein VMG12_01220 [Polyangiaceae bacterium]|nr:hypothetical protein [Polyangiaceae bacterium]
MSEHSVQVVISGQGGQQIQLRVQGNTLGRPVVLQVASVSTPAPARLGAPLEGATVVPPSGGPAISLELRFREATPAVVAPEPPRDSTAPLARAWATAQRLRERSPSSRPPRPRSTRGSAS